MNAFLSKTVTKQAPHPKWTEKTRKEGIQSQYYLFNGAPVFGKKNDDSESRELPL